jgi:hypothetical protein
VITAFSSASSTIFLRAITKVENPMKLTT